MPHSKKLQNQSFDSCDLVCKQEPIQQLKKKPLQQQQPLLTIPSSSSFLFAKYPTTTQTTVSAASKAPKHPDTHQLNTNSSGKTMTQSILSNSIADKMNQKTSSNASSTNNNNNNDKDCDTSDTSDSDEVIFFLSFRRGILGMNLIFDIFDFSWIGIRLVVE